MNAQAKHWIVPISGLSCAGCVNRLQKGLSEHPQILHANVNLALETLDVEISDTNVSATDLAHWVQDAGYQLKQETRTLQLQGISCAGCINKIETSLKQMDGISEVAANLATGQVRISWVPGITDEQNIRQRLADIGYPAEPSPLDTEAPDSHRHSSVNTFTPVLIGAALSLPMVVAMLASLIGLPWMLPSWLQFALTTPVQFWLGARFFIGAWNSLRRGSANMDVLVVMGTSAAYFYSLYLWWFEQSQHLYFEASAVIVTLILLGKWMEQRAKSMTGDAIRQLMHLQPRTAMRWQDGQLEKVYVSDLQLGDELQIQPGDTIPADGRVVSGESDLDESMLTGESRAVHKKQNDMVLAGTRNLDGALRIQTQSSPEQFRLKQIIRLVENAQMSKPPVQQLVDRIAAVFVPAVIVIALITLAIQSWLQGFESGLLTAVSVLVIACPCALGLATPTAIIAASGAGARRGILIRDISQLESLAKADLVIFDKTGTLTEGKPRVIHADSWSNEPESVEQIVYSIQQQSQHPLAQAIVRYLSDRVSSTESPVESFRNLSGEGVIAEVDGQIWLIGNEQLLARHHLAPDDIQRASVNLNASHVWVATNEEIVARFDLADSARPEAFALIRFLKDQQLEPWILSGDHPDAVQAQSEALGIEQYQGNLMPDHKLQVIERLKDKGKTVIMVGDGINDAPALASASASIAMGSGTDVAMETAGITLMRPELSLVAESLQLARKAHHKIWQNLFWAFIYNVIGIPLAALGLLNPVIAGAAMAFSSVSVVSSSLLLLRWKPKETLDENQ